MSGFAFNLAAHLASKAPSLSHHVDETLDMGTIISDLFSQPLSRSNITPKLIQDPNSADLFGFGPMLPHGINQHAVPTSNAIKFFGIEPHINLSSDELIESIRLIIEHFPNHPDILFEQANILLDNISDFFLNIDIIMAYLIPLIPSIMLKLLTNTSSLLCIIIKHYKLVQALILKMAQVFPILVGQFLSIGLAILRSNDLFFEMIPQLGINLDIGLKYMSKHNSACQLYKLTQIIICHFGVDFWTIVLKIIIPQIPDLMVAFYELLIYSYMILIFLINQISVITDNINVIYDFLVLVFSKIYYHRKGLLCSAKADIKSISQAIISRENKFLENILSANILIAEITVALAQNAQLFFELAIITILTVLIGTVMVIIELLGALSSVIDLLNAVLQLNMIPLFKSILNVIFGVKIPIMFMVNGGICTVTCAMGSQIVENLLTLTPWIAALWAGIFNQFIQISLFILNTIQEYINPSE